MEITLIILFFALLLDWYFGEPDILWSRFPHPVVVFGKAIKFCEQRFNRDKDGDGLRYRKGALVISGLIIVSIFVGILLHKLFAILGPFGWMFSSPYWLSAVYWIM
jgi:adenosylcobinamide-phosphate synthase